MIPTSPTKFKRWMAQERGTWSCELYAKGKFALLTLRSLKGQEKAFAQSKAFREGSLKYLRDFAEAYRLRRGEP